MLKKARHVDDRPYGGGRGCCSSPTHFDAFAAIEKKNPALFSSIQLESSLIEAYAEIWPRRGTIFICYEGVWRGALRPCWQMRFPWVTMSWLVESWRLWPWLMLQYALIPEIDWQGVTSHQDVSGLLRYPQYTALWLSWYGCAGYSDERAPWKGRQWRLYESLRKPSADQFA